MSEKFIDQSPTKKKRRGRPPTKPKQENRVGESTLNFAISSNISASNNSAATIRQGAICSTPVMKVSPGQRRSGSSGSSLHTPTPKRRKQAPGLVTIQETGISKAHQELASITQREKGYLDSSPITSSSGSSPSASGLQSSPINTSPLNSSDQLMKHDSRTADLNPSLLQPDILAPKTPRSNATPSLKLPPSTPISHFSHVLSSSPMYTHWYAQTPHGRVASTPNSLVPKPLRFEELRPQGPGTTQNAGLGILGMRNKSMPLGQESGIVQLQNKLRKTQSMNDIGADKHNFQVTVQLDSKGKAMVVKKRRRVTAVPSPAMYGTHFAGDTMYSMEPPPGLKIGVDPFVVGISANEMEMKSPYMMAEELSNAARLRSDARFALRELLKDL
ncbi:hypothetical protein OGAPHI_006693 [Ogataea philodendri]|uniref:Uncharacterized protein n=1 Tax=Ogataea philodendri TaxID=1378263 RepID=A0A9P8NXZ8_9ASCO|nr:uncharacterized protein OGAPHI_006693 [Ogataea philodendri]KAH3661286.1 hypothetical protein OGAPHI_006693 [Ogataea philodendri]